MQNWQSKRVLSSAMLQKKIPKCAQKWWMHGVQIGKHEGTELSHAAKMKKEAATVMKKMPTFHAITSSFHCNPALHTSQ